MEGGQEETESFSEEKWSERYTWKYGMK
jgi:hypothetical protein